MTTTTDLREQSGSRETAVLNQLTATGLTMVTTGFMLYPTRMVNERVIVPGVAYLQTDTVTLGGQTFRHTPKLVVHEDDVIGTIPGVVPHDHLYSFDATKYDISFASDGTAAGAEAIGFENVVDFHSISCGLELAHDWRKRVAFIPYDGGQIVAIPDDYYVQQECEWTECGVTKDGKPITQRKRLTSLTAYTPPAQNVPTIVLTPRINGSSQVSIQFRSGPVFAALTNFAEGVDPKDYAIDLSHIETMMRLSTVVGEVRFTLGRIITNPLNLPTALQWPGWLTKTLRKEQTFAGRPHCGARQMREPTA